MIGKAGLVLGLALLSTTALAAGTVSPNAVNPPGVAGPAFQINPMISNQPGVAQRLDRSLVNPWGVGAIPGNPLWVNINGGHKSSIFGARNFKQDGKVRVGDGPTGIIDIPANPNGSDFNITEGTATGPSLFAFVTTGGLLQGWNPSVDPAKAVTALDRSGGTSVFTGVSFIAENRTLLLADFGNGFVEMFDGGFNQTGHFTDNTLPPNFEPFNVSVVKGKVYVAFAERDPTTGDEVKGAGLGYVDVFDHRGNLTSHLISAGALNAPWGMTIAPAGFGQFAGDLLVGNFGDGTINAYDPGTGTLVGTLSGSDGNPLVIDGLWGLKAGPGGSIVFAAGPNDEQNGLVGTVSVVSTTVASK
jgi:uncharacterized protein (TIGR03118 family)